MPLPALRCACDARLIHRPFATPHPVHRSCFKHLAIDVTFQCATGRVPRAARPPVPRDLPNLTSPRDPRGSGPSDAPLRFADVSRPYPQSMTARLPLVNRSGCGHRYSQPSFAPHARTPSSPPHDRCLFRTVNDMTALRARARIVQPAPRIAAPQAVGRRRPLVFGRDEWVRCVPGHTTRKGQHRGRARQVGESKRQPECRGGAWASAFQPETLRPIRRHQAAPAAAVTVNIGQ